jgi:hypothetical protein
MVLHRLHMDPQLCDASVGRFKPSRPRTACARARARLLRPCSVRSCARSPCGTQRVVPAERMFWLGNGTIVPLTYLQKANGPVDGGTVLPMALCFTRHTACAVHVRCMLHVERCTLQSARDILFQAVTGQRVSLRCIACHCRYISCCTLYVAHAHVNCMPCAAWHAVPSDVCCRQQQCVLNASSLCVLQGRFRRSGTCYKSLVRKCAI